MFTSCTEYKNRKLRIIMGHKKKQEAGENYIMMSFIICNLYQVLLG
jgi:hypothetical protein